MAAGHQRSQPGVYLKGLTDLRQVLRRAGRDLDKALARSLREIGKRVKGNVQSVARRYRDSGDLERSIRYSVKAKAASVYTNSPYGAVHEWGGTITPRGVPIHIPRREWMNEGVRKSRREVDSSLERVLDDLANWFDG